VYCHVDATRAQGYSVLLLLLLAAGGRRRLAVGCLVSWLLDWLAARLVGDDHDDHGCDGLAKNGLGRIIVCA